MNLLQIILQFRILKSAETHGKNLTVVLSGDVGDELFGATTSTPLKIN
jgi:asparagine synthetase B (glutamine-hydrolysing)